MRIKNIRALLALTVEFMLPGEPLRPLLGAMENA